MENKGLQKFLKISIYFFITFCFVSCLFVFKTWIFPFITSKAIPFRASVEILAFLYIILMLNFKEYRPKKSWILYSLLIFTLIAIVTSIFGINPHLSFIGDLERMWGINTWLHLVIFFIVITNFLKTKKEWFVFFNLILLFASIIAIVAYLQIWGVYSVLMVRQGLESLLGNIAYIAGLTLLGVLLSLYLFIDKKEWWWKALYSLHIIIQLPILIKTQIRGAHVGLYLALLIISLVFIFKSKKKYIKIGLLTLIVLFVSLFTFAFLNKDQQWVKGNPIFSKMTTISAQTGTVRTRLISWNSGLKAFSERPLTGYGMENYYYAFDKYFPGSYYTVSPGETWFDRAHNMVVETLVAHGIFGLIAYLSIFVITLLFLYKVYKIDKEKNFLFYLFFSCIVIAYFVQNLFVFDSLAVTSTFFFILAYINFRYTQDTEQEDIFKKNFSNILKWSVGIISSILLLYIIFNVDIVQANVARQNYIVQKSLYQDNDFKKSYDELKKLYDIDSYLNKDSTTMLTDTVSNIYSRSQSQDQIKAVYDIISFLIDQYAHYININDKEAYMHMNLARLYLIRANFFPPKSQDSLNNLNLAKQEIDKSIELSKERLHNYYFMANIEMALDHPELAIKSLETAISYNDKYGESYYILANLYQYLGDKENSEKYMKKALELDPSLKQGSTN